MLYDRHLRKEFIITVVINVHVSHLSGENKFLQENIFFQRKNNFPLEYLRFPTGIKELPIRIKILTGLE